MIITEPKIIILMPLKRLFKITYKMTAIEEEWKSEIDKLEALSAIEKENAKKALEQISTILGIFICTSHAPGIFPAIIKELADGILLSSVPVMIKVELDIFVSSSQMSLQLIASQFCEMLFFCCCMILGGIPANKS
jgi:hypothetical protein